jgi:hypothetical protein
MSPEQCGDQINKIGAKSPVIEIYVRKKGDYIIISMVYEFAILF